MSKATARTRARSKKPAIDQITTEVISHRLLAASEEMLATLVKTAYSPNIKERRDCSVGIFDVRSNLIALSAIGPIHLSSLMGLVDNVLKRHPLDGLAPGDCFMTNDPYVGGGSHLPDITLVTPVFVDGRVVGFVTNLAHHSDIGGRVAGSESSDCTSIFQEGLRIPPVRLVAGGTLLQDIFDFLLLNSRTPREREGDIKAQLATNAIGVERLTECFRRFGTETMLAGIDAILDYSEARARAAIAALPDGVYEHEEFLDNDGLEDRLVRMAVKITIKGDGIAFDFTGTDPQVPGARNLPLIGTLAAIYYAVKALMDPDLPPNSGYYRAIEVIAPKGTLVNAAAPAAVSDRAASGNILGDLIFGALAKADPKRVMAACGPYQGIIYSGIDPRNREYFVDYETYAGATGGQHDHDGKDAVRVHVSGAANLPIEAVEQEFSLAVLRYELIPDTGGPGRQRGGLGTRRDVMILAEDGRIAGRGLRQIRGAPGFDGGGSGSLGRFVLDPGTTGERRLPGSFSELPMPPGSVIRMESPSGAGYGRAGERDPDAVRADVLSGKVTADGAARDYGVVCRGDTVDAARTRQRRESMARRRAAG